VRRQLRSEFAKLTTTPTVPAVVAALVGLAALAVVLHAYGLPASNLATRLDQRGIFIDVAINLGAVFAALLGALSITAEIRSGTIRPTFLTTPRRATVIRAKAVSVLATGVLIGLVATGTVAGVGALALDLRGLTVRLTAGDYAQLLIGGALGGGLLAVVGLAVGAVLRAQVPTLVALLTWLLFVENLLTDLPTVHRFVPGALGQALAGGDRDGLLHTPWIAAVILLAYAAATLTAATLATSRRDVA
jgi:ABC-type transport system involved in multi-copper enzyme maturation permease subunit